VATPPHLVPAPEVPDPGFALERHLRRPDVAPRSGFLEIDLEPPRVGG